jgi:hypothetical protein
MGPVGGNSVPEAERSATPLYALSMHPARLLVLGTALVLATVGIVLAVVSLSNPTSSAETQLKAALKATFNA